jgi:hypothetical protein
MKLLTLFTLTPCVVSLSNKLDTYSTDFYSIDSGIVHAKKRKNYPCRLKDKEGWAEAQGLQGVGGEQVL